MQQSADTRPPLLTGHELEQLRQLALEAGDRQRLANSAPEIGYHRSTFRGQGMELHDVRPYQPGDDIRHIDWRATARSGKPSSKVFIEERARNLVLIIDRRAPMLFGTRHDLKITTAGRISALLTFSALAVRESVAGFIIEDRLLNYPAARYHDQAMPLLHRLTETPEQPSTAQMPALTASIQTVLQNISTQSNIMIISDFHDVASDQRQLWRLLGQRYNTHAVYIIDRGEEELADIGRLRLRSPLTGRDTLIDTSDKTLRQRYAAEAARRRGKIEQLFGACDIPFRTVYTHDNVMLSLQGWL